MNSKIRFNILQRYGFKCVYCGRGARQAVELQVDHVVPRSLGGKDEQGNLVSACRDCNRGKSNVLLHCRPASIEPDNPVYRTKKSPPQYIKQLMQEHGVSIQDAALIAQRKGCHLSTMALKSLLIGALKNPGVQTVHAVAMVFNRPPEEVMSTFL